LNDFRFTLVKEMKVQS